MRVYLEAIYNCSPIGTPQEELDNPIFHIGDITTGDFYDELKLVSVYGKLYNSECFDIKDLSEARQERINQILNEG